MTDSETPKDEAAKWAGEASKASWYMIRDEVVNELIAAVQNREDRGDSPNAGDVQRAHLRVQRALEALGREVLPAR